MSGLSTFMNGLTMGAGDWGSLSQLFFDNLSTLLGALFAVQAMENFGVDRSVIDPIVWGRLVPGVGVTLFVGNIYYSWQAIRLTNKWGRQYTAQPYGLNTPAAFSVSTRLGRTTGLDRTRVSGASQNLGR
jgi:AGZA family xanthine/uracil permease-like MFS transporter